MLAALLLLAAGSAPAAVEAASTVGREAILSAGRSVARVEGAPVPAIYDPAGRAVANWQGETLRALEPRPLAALAWLGPAETRVTTRCVRLNNYWCVKRAGWVGEVGADGEGHAAFASAEAGADAAAALLRRYYLEFGRRSALDIVRRWAPAECGPPPSPAAPPLATASPRPLSRPAPGRAATGAPAVAGLPLATRGLGRTLRARYLAARRGAARRAVARSRPARPAPAAPRAAPRLPAIAAGLPELAVPTLTLAALPATASFGALLAAPARPCADEDARQRNYAARIVAGLGLGPSDDLRLFAPDGAPLANLAPVLAAMSGFELGALRAGRALVERAVARLPVRASAEAEPRGSPPGPNPASPE